MALRRILPLAGVATLAASATVAFAVRDAADSSAVVVTVDAARPGRVVPASFLGLSLELPAVAQYAGSPARPNHALVRLLHTLGAAQGSPPALRIGGNSSDESWWAPGAGATPVPRIVHYVLGVPWLGRLAWLERATGAPLTVGVNLAANDPRRALAFARALRGALPPGAIRTLEIGNEPDLYARAAAFHAGRLVVHRVRRHASYGQARYAADVRRYASLLAGAPRTGPAVAAGGFATVAWDPALAGVLRGEHGRIRALSAHAYPVNGCPPHARRAAQLRRLLSAAATDRLAAGVARMVAIGRAAGIPVRVTEMNSATCGGVPGISDTFASALWAPGALFALARTGVTGVDLHSWPRAPYAPFAFNAARGATRAQARPLLYGMLLFADAVGHGSRLLDAHVATGGPARAWATSTRAGGVDVVVVNPSATAAARVTVAVRGAGARPAALRLLRAPGLLAHGPVTLGGRAIGPDGRWHGRDRAVRVAPRAGRYALTVPAASAALLAVAPPGRPHASVRIAAAGAASRQSTKHAPPAASARRSSPSI